jgi:hypothetical protein
MKSFIIICLVLLTFSSKGQTTYPVSQTDLIFSLASMNSTAVSSSPVVRFSGFINHEWQLHIDFNKSLGLYTGIGLKNIGMINHFDNYGINFKQRAYALGVPLAFKLGSMKGQTYIVVGGEANIMTQYKQKFLFDNTKMKHSEWFSNKVNLFNPAVFFQFKFMKSQIITVKYFLRDFLRYQSGGLTLPDAAGTNVSDYGQSSKLFYISWGSSIAIKDPVIEQKKQQNIKSARWVE